MRRCLAALTLVLGACAFDAPADDPRSPSTAELIGGDLAADTAYPSTVHHYDGCTFAKVGPRHFMTAGHCAIDNTGALNPPYRGGAAFWLTDHNSPSPPPDMSQYKAFTVERTHVHPAWLQACRDTLAQNPNQTECADPVPKLQRGPDVAIVVVAELSPHIPEAAVDLTPVAVNDPLHIVGYGCEQPGGRPVPRLKTESVPAVSLDALKHDGQYSFLSHEAVYGGYVITAGHHASGAYASLCPGDSGGALYREGTAQPLVVGVNAYYSFPVGRGWEEHASLTNWHTRLGRDSAYDVDQWLSGIGGVNLTESSPATPGGGGGPCEGVCTAPQRFSSLGFQAGNLGAAAACYETRTTPIAGACGGFAGGRTLTINGTTVLCDSGNFSMPPAVNGGYCFNVSAGDNAWAWFAVW